MGGYEFDSCQTRCSYSVVYLIKKKKIRSLYIFLRMKWTTHRGLHVLGKEGEPNYEIHTYGPHRLIRKSEIRCSYKNYKYSTRVNWIVVSPILLWDLSSINTSTTPHTTRVKLIWKSNIKKVKSNKTKQRAVSYGRRSGKLQKKL